MGKYLRLIEFLKKVPTEVCVRTAIALSMVACSFLQAFFLAKGVAAVIGNGDMREVLRCLAICMAALAARCLLVRYQEGYVKKMAAKVKAVIRSTMLFKLMCLGPAYKNDRRTGDLQSLITDGVESFEAFLVQYLPQTAVVFVTTFASTVYLRRLEPIVGMIVFLMSVCSIALPHLFMPAVSRVMIEYWRDYAGLNSQYIDSMQGMSTLKSLGQSRKEGEKLAGSAWGFAKESMKNLGISLSDSAVIVFCTAVGTAASVTVAAYQMACGNLSYEGLLLILFLTGETMKPISDMNNYWHSSYLGLSVAEELFRLLDEPLRLEDRGTCTTLERKIPGISLNDVSFRYEEGGAEILKHVNMEMSPGRMTALVGKSGSGKTTVVNLLLRFYDANAGEIMLDGKDIREFPVEFLRKQIAVVFQESYLFYGTIRENLLLASPGASEKEMIEAAKAANAHSFIMAFPEGYDTVVGERGATLSGGERQRISIARAILKDAPILILDEATSSVDLLHETLIQEALERCMKDKTTIVIAHRLSAVEHADRIYVLEEGSLAGYGTHQELLKKNAVYKGLVKAQEYAEKR